MAALRKSTTCVVVKTCDHVSFSRTFGGRNSSQQIHVDGKDLFKAAEADINAWVPVWKEKGWSDEKISGIRNEVHEQNKKLFNGMGIDYGS